MIAITTNSSIRVKPRRRERMEGLLWRGDEQEFTSRKEANRAPQGPAAERPDDPRGTAREETAINPRGFRRAERRSARRVCEQSAALCPGGCPAGGRPLPGAAPGG